MAILTKAQIKRLQKTLKTDQAIGSKFGITRQAVYQMRRKYGLGFVRDKQMARNARIFALRRKDMIIRVIAKKIGLSIGQVSRILRGYVYRKK